MIEPDLSREGVSTEALLGPLTDLELRNAPARLYFAGRRELLVHRPRVAVVGSREATDAGLKRAERVAKLLATESLTVVSGLARGIDTVAHETAIAMGTGTIAVLGGPLDNVQPVRNRELFRRIAESQLAISQFAPGHPVLRSNYPQRNRTMALIADASIIVEAGEGSGTLSQGWEALRLGRPLFLLRSVVENESLSWPKEMIQYGALVLREPEDLFEVLPCAGFDAAAQLAF
ncbi:MAG: DNA-processing protein DprA [Thermoanaerobaculia bacterium]